MDSETPVHPSYLALSLDKRLDSLTILKRKVQVSGVKLNAIVSFGHLDVMVMFVTFVSKLVNAMFAFAVWLRVLLTLHAVIEISRGTKATLSCYQVLG